MYVMFLKILLENERLTNTILFDESRYTINSITCKKKKNCKNDNSEFCKHDNCLQKIVSKRNDYK